MRPHSISHQPNPSYTYVASGSKTCSSHILHYCSDEVSRAPGMQALMQNQTKLAQELIIAMVDGQSPARKKQKL